jgi:hypothetical protein
LGIGVGVGFAFGLGAIALGLVDLAVRGFAVLGVAALRVMDFLDVFRFAMSPPGVWLVVRVCGAVGDVSGGNSAAPMTRIAVALDGKRCPMILCEIRVNGWRLIIDSH